MAETTPSGYSSPAYSSAPAGEKYNVLSIVSLVLAFLVSLGAVICGHIALSQIKKTGEKCRGLAIAGIVLGNLGIVIGLIIGIAFIGTFATTLSTTTGY